MINDRVSAIFFIEIKMCLSAYCESLGLVGTLMYLALKVFVNGVFTVLLIPVLKTGMYLALLSSAV
jgi:hypothetical protein